MEQFLICWVSVVADSNAFSVLHLSVVVQWFQQTWVQPVWFLLAGQHGTQAELLST